MSKSGKIVFDQAPSERDEMNMSSSLSGALASNPSASSKDVVFNRDASMSTALLRLPDDFETRQTIDGMFADLEDKPKLHAKTYGEDDDDAEEEEEEEGGGGGGGGAVGHRRDRCSGIGGIARRQEGQARHPRVTTEDASR
jgi:hypothetical protein